MEFFNKLNCELETYINICKKKTEDLKLLTNTENIVQRLKEKIREIQVGIEIENNKIANKVGNFLELVTNYTD